jgi:Rrf2 family protein
LCTEAGQNIRVRISAKTDYAVRAALELAAGSADGSWIKTETVAERQGIPLPFLLNILAELRTAGLVQSRRGAEGGYRLALPAAEIKIADVIRAIDGPLANIAGERPEDVAYAGAAVALRDIWVALRAKMRVILEGATLADVAGGQLPDDVTALLKDEDVWRARI